MVVANLANGDVITEAWTDSVTADVNPTAWTAVTFANAWVDNGSSYQVCQYRKIGDVVNLRGLMKNGTIGLAAFTLPLGFRPPADLYFATVANSLFATLLINAAGVVNITTGTNVWASINCSFSTV